MLKERKKEELKDPSSGSTPKGLEAFPGGSNFLSFGKHYKAFIFVIVLQTFTLCMSVSGYHYLLPLKETVPVFVGVMDSRDYVYEVFPVNEIEGREALAKYFLRGYVVARETIDRQTEPTRVAQVQAMSSYSVFNIFRKIMNDPQNGLYHTEGFKRSIKILRDDAIAQKGDYKVHELDIVTEDRREEGAYPGKVDRNEWNIKIAYRFDPQRIQVDDSGRIPNPSGLNVIEYTLSHRRDLNAEKDS